MLLPRQYDDAHKEKHFVCYKGTILSVCTGVRNKAGSAQIIMYWLKVESKYCSQ